MTHHQYRISVENPQTSVSREIIGGIAECQFSSQANVVPCIVLSILPALHTNEEGVGGGGVGVKPLDDRE